MPLWEKGLFYLDLEYSSIIPPRGTAIPGGKTRLMKKEYVIKQDDI
jgi:hypothetical protein